MIQFELPLYNNDDRQLLLHAADRLAEYASPDDSAVLLQRLAHRLGRVLQSAENTKYTLQVRYVLEMDGRRQSEATIAPEGYVNCNVDLLYIEEKHDLTYQVLPLWEDAGIAFNCYSQGGGGDMYTIIDPSRAEEAREIAWQTQQKFEQWYRDNPETEEELAAREARAEQWRRDNPEPKSAEEVRATIARIKEKSAGRTATATGTMIDEENT